MDTEGAQGQRSPASDQHPRGEQVMDHQQPPGQHQHQQQEENNGDPQPGPSRIPLQPSRNGASFGLSTAHLAAASPSASSVSPGPVSSSSSPAPNSPRVVNGNGLPNGNHVDTKGKGRAVEDPSEGQGDAPALAEGQDDSVDEGAPTDGLIPAEGEAAGAGSPSAAAPDSAGTPLEGTSTGRAISKPAPKPPPPRKPKAGKRFPLKQGLEKLIIQAQRKDPGYYFAEPVDTDAVPDYLSVIAEPMDFGTIRTRVEQNAYRDAASFERDMRLVVDNAMLFNAPTTQYWQVAERISRWLPRAVERETELAITPAEEEALQEEERRKQEQIQRNLAMGLTADGKPRRGGRRKQTADIVPEGYVPAALRFGLPTDPAAGVGGGSATPGGDTPQDSGRGSLARDMSASRSVTPGTAARRRTSASPVKQDPDGDENGDMGSPADGDVDPSGSSASYRRRSMRGGPRASISAARAARQSLLGIGPRLTASNIHDAAEGITSLQLSYRPDGSIDPSDIEDPATTLLSSVYSDSERVLAPMLTAVVGVPRESEPQVKRRKNPVTGKEAVMLTEPGDVQETYSHELGALPPGMQQLPFSLPAHSAGPWKSPLQLDEFGLPLRWPVGVKLRATPIVPAQAAAVQLANQNDWTYNHLRPTIKKLLSHTDVGPYANVVPARAVNPKGELSDFSYLHGETLRKALIDEQHSVPALALAIPDVPAIPTDLTHLIWTNMYRDYKPHLTEVVQQGIRGSTLLRNVVYGSAIGEAYTRSIAEFVGGAARGVVERYGPAEDEVEQAEPQQVVGKMTAEAQADLLPPVKREREESPSLGPAGKRVKLEQDDSALPEMPLVEEAAPEPDMLDQPLVDWVRDKIVDPLTGGHLKLLIAVAEGFRRHPGETAGEGEKHTVGENADPALLASVEEALRDVDAAAAAEAASDAAPLDPLLAESLASITTDPSPRMRYNELKRLFESRIDLSEFVVPAPDLPEPGPTGSIADVASGTPLIRFAASGEDMTDERVEAALQQYAAVFADISKRGRELDRKSLLDNLRKGLLQIAVKRAPPAEMMQLPKHLVTYLRSLQAAATSPSA